MLGLLLLGCAGAAATYLVTGYAEYRYLSLPYLYIIVLIAGLVISAAGSDRGMPVGTGVLGVTGVVIAILIVGLGGSIGSPARKAALEDRAAEQTALPALASGLERCLGSDDRIVMGNATLAAQLSAVYSVPTAFMPRNFETSPVMPQTALAFANRFGITHVYAAQEGAAALPMGILQPTECEAGLYRIGAGE